MHCARFVSLMTIGVPSGVLMFESLRTRLVGHLIATSAFW